MGMNRSSVRVRLIPPYHPRRFSSIVVDLIGFQGPDCREEPGCIALSRSDDECAGMLVVIVSESHVHPSRASSIEFFHCGDYFCCSLELICRECRVTFVSFEPRNRLYEFQTRFIHQHQIVVQYIPVDRRSHWRGKVGWPILPVFQVCVNFFASEVPRRLVILRPEHTCDFVKRGSLARHAMEKHLAAEALRSSCRL